MLDWFEGRRRWPLAALVVLLLILMMAGEALNNDEPFWSVDQLLDFANDLLLVGTTVACTLLALRLGANEEETRMLRADMALVRAESWQWRDEMRTNFARSDRRSGASSTLGA